MKLAFNVGSNNVPDVPGTHFPLGTTLGTVVNDFLKYFFPIVGLLLLFYLIWGGFTLFTSAGDPKAMEQGKGKITGAIVGFIIFFAAFWIVQILDFITGSPGFLQ